MTLNQEEIERIKKRIGWLCSECGGEDFKIKQLEKELLKRKARRDAMWKESNHLMEKLEDLGLVKKPRIM